MKNLISSIIIAIVKFTISSCSKEDLPNVAESSYLNYYTKTALELPFDEEL